MLCDKSHPSEGLPLAEYIPGVSVKTIFPLSSSYRALIGKRVVCGFGEVMATFWPIKLLRKVDFPTLGLPISKTFPIFIAYILYKDSLLRSE